MIFRSALLGAAVIAAGAVMAPVSAASLCNGIKIVQVEDKCLDGTAACPSRQYAYKATLRNETDKDVHFTYKFARPGGETGWIGGTSVPARSDLVRPIGIGVSPIPAGEDEMLRRKRMLLTHCGHDESFRYKWQEANRVR